MGRGEGGQGEKEEGELAWEPCAFIINDLLDPTPSVNVCMYACLCMCTTLTHTHTHTEVQTAACNTFIVKLGIPSHLITPYLGAGLFWGCILLLLVDHQALLSARRRSLRHSSNLSLYLICIYFVFIGWVFLCMQEHFHTFQVCRSIYRCIKQLTFKDCTRLRGLSVRADDIHLGIRASMLCKLFAFIFYYLGILLYTGVMRNSKFIRTSVHLSTVVWNSAPMRRMQTLPVGGF